MATNRERVLELASDKTLAGVPAEYNGMGETVEPHCGDVMRIYLQVNPRQVVVGAGFTISEGACAPVVASAALAAKLALDKPVMAAYTVNREDLAKELSDDGTLDQEHVHCAIMAELTLKRAVLDYVTHRQAPVRVQGEQ